MRVPASVSCRGRWLYWCYRCGHKKPRRKELFSFLLSRCRPCLPLLGCSRRRGHFGVKIEQLFQPFGIVAEPPSDIDALQNFVVALVRFSQIDRHFLLVIKVSDCGWEMSLSRQQYVFKIGSASCRESVCQFV